VKPLERFRYFILFLVVLFLAGCASSGDLRALRSEMSQRTDEKISSLEAEVNALKENATALESMRKGQANTMADLAELRENLQQLRGQVETLKKDASQSSRKDEQLLNNMLLRINFIENFLEIGSKNTSDASDKTGKVNGGSVAKDTGSKQDKDKAYSAAYQIFQEGNYAKARNEFQTFLTTYPNSEYSDNAQFWIGECYFFEKKYESAILEYEKVTKNYPKGNKVPYALLKQGLSFLKLGDKTSAKLLLQEVIKNYPNTSQARIARSNLQDIK
jgi:tol-pal system protein YbgF